MSLDCKTYPQTSHLVDMGFDICMTTTDNASRTALILETVLCCESLYDICEVFYSCAPCQVFTCQFVDIPSASEILSYGCNNVSTDAHVPQGVFY